MGVLEAPACIPVRAPQEPVTIPLANAGWGWLHLVWSRDHEATAGGVVAVGPGDVTGLVVPAGPPLEPGGSGGRILLKSRTGPRHERWRIPSPSVRTVHLQWEPGRGEEASALPAPGTADEPSPRSRPPEDCLVIFCEPDRWDAWAVLPTLRLVRRLGGGGAAVTSGEELDAARQESRRLFLAWCASPRAMPATLVVLDDTPALAALSSLPSLADAQVRSKSRLILQGWRVRRIPGPEEAFVGILDVDLELVTLRLLTQGGNVMGEWASDAFSARTRSAVVDECLAGALPVKTLRGIALEEWLEHAPLDALQHPDERSDMELPAGLTIGTTARSIPRAPMRRALLHALDKAIDSLVAAPLPHAEPILAFGAGLDLEAVRRHLTGRSLRLCSDRAQPLCCLGLLAAATVEPHLELEAIEGNDQVSRIDLPFQLSPGPDRVDLTYELPANRTLALRLYERVGFHRRLLGEAAVPAPGHDARLVLLVRETARGRLSVDLHDRARGCREILEVPAR